MAMKNNYDKAQRKYGANELLIFSFCLILIIFITASTKHAICITENIPILKAYPINSAPIKGKACVNYAIAYNFINLTMSVIFLIKLIINLIYINTDKNVCLYINTIANGMANKIVRDESVRIRSPKFYYICYLSFVIIEIILIFRVDQLFVIDMFRKLYLTNCIIFFFVASFLSCLGLYLVTLFFAPVVISIWRRLWAIWEGE